MSHTGNATRIDAMHPSDHAISPADYGPILMVHGHYRVVALKPSSDDHGDGPAGYAVVTSAGGLVRRELALDDAKQWAQKLAETEQGVAPPDSAPAPAPARTRRKRR